MARNECGSHAIVIHLTNIIISVRFNSSSSQVETGMNEKHETNQTKPNEIKAALLIKI